ncbi:MAG TPA: DUF4126 domain-containing protein [Burkholderiaceae bacterium]|jgi:hypothetical protein|nr:DUF4126 domain-containing protein [Burkholderiaceae bacterium]
MTPPDLDTAHLVALAAALGWASGVRLYLVVFLTGLAGALGWVALPPGLHVLQSPLLLVASGVLATIEFVADKIPAVNAFWDGLHTLLRVPGGAVLAAAAFGGDQAQWTLVAALAGGALAATSHVAKTTTTASLTTLPEPVTHAGVSLVSDLSVPAMLWLSLSHPAVFAVVLAVVVVTMVGITVVLFRFLRALTRRLLGRPA